MNTPIKLLYQGNNLFFPLTCSEGVLVKDGESVALLTEVLLKKLELLIGGSGIVTQQTSDTSYVIGHTNKIDSLETSSPRLITYDSNGHITSSVPFNKMIISLNDGTELSSYDGSSEKTITLSSNFKTTDGKLDINWGYITNQGYITSSALDGYATQNWVNGKNYITLKSLSISDSTGVTQAYLDRELGVNNITYDNTTGLFKITKTWFLTEHQDLSDYATYQDLNNYALSSSLTSHTTNSNIHVTSALKTAWTTASNWVSSVTATDSSDADTAINKWNEIIDFLANISDTSTLQGILAAKANSSDLDNYLPLSGGTITGNLAVNGTTTFISQVYAYNGFATSSPVIVDKKLQFLLNSLYNDLGVISVDVIDSSNHTYNFDGGLNVQGGLSIQGDFSIDGGFTGKSLTLLNPWNYIDSNTYKHAEIYLNDDSTPSLEFDNVSSVYFGNAYVLADTFNGKILGYIYGTLQRPLTITINGLSSEGTTKYTYNNSASKSLNIAQGLNVSFATESGKLTISATDTTYSPGIGLALNDTTFNLLSASTSTIGGVKVSSVSSSAVTLSDSNKIYGVQSDSDGLAYVNVPWTDQKVKISSATSGSLYFTGNSSTSSTSGTTLSVFSYAFVTMEKGSTSKEGTMTFTLGNNKTSTTASNESGILKLYGANTGSTSLRSQAVTSDITVYLPTASGTLALTTDIPSLTDYVKSSELATVAKTGSYTDLSNKPTIPTVPSTLPNPSSLSVNYNGTNLWTYNGSDPRTLNLKNGSNISITKDDSGNIVIANTYSYSLPTATTSTSGGIIVGNNLSINNGVLSAVNTTYSEATQSAAGLMSSTDKAKLDGIASGANKYSLPTASTDTLGGIKVGSYLAISSGVLSVSSSPLATTTIIGGIKLISDTKNTVTLTASTSTSKCYPVLLNSNNVAYVQVPWVDTDTNTTYSAGNYLSLSGTTFNHKTSGVGDSSTASGSAGTLNFGSSIKIPSISYDSYGHITGVSSTTVTLPSNPNTDTHYTSNLIVNSSSSSTSNTTSTISNGSVYLNLIENNLVRNSHKIVGSGATTVTSDASGNLTINSPSLSITTSGSGNAITALSYGSGTITATLGSTFALKSDIPTNYVTTDTEQTISGAKTFSGNVTFSSRPTLSSGAKLGADTIFSADRTYNIGSASTRAHYVYAARLLAVETICNSTTYSTNMITLPSKSGTMALTSDIPSLDGYIKASGTSAQFVKGDGSLDSNSYLTTSGTAVASNSLAKYGTATSTYKSNSIIYSIVPYADLGTLTGYNNANGIISISTGGQNYLHQLAFTDSGMFYRYYNGTFDDTAIWRRVAMANSIPTKLSELTNDVPYAKQSELSNYLGINDTAVNSDKLGGYDLGWFYKLGNIDLSSLDADTWYPVSFQIATERQTRISIFGSLEHRVVGNWNYSDNRAIFRITFETNPSGYGWADINENIICAYQKNPNVGSSGQIFSGVKNETQSTQVLIYLRGGANYYYQSNYNATPTIWSEGYQYYISLPLLTSAPSAPSRTNALISDNVASATKLYTSRSLWGQSFDGTADVTGLLTASTGSTHLGIKLGTSYLNSLGGNIILQNNTAIRFGTSDSWDYNVWAGLKYDSTNKIISLGLADGTIFTANSAQTGGTLQLVNLSTIRPNTNNTGSLGSSSFYFNSAYINNIYGTVSKASALTSNAGSSSNPIYFSNGVPTACGYTILTSVPADAKFTDTTYTFSSENATLKWATSTKIATVGGTEIYVSLPINPNTNTEYSAGTGLSLSNTTFNLKTATTSAIGGMKASNALTSAVSLTSSNGATSSRYYGVQVDSNGLAFVNVPWSDTNITDTVGATTSTNTLYLVGVTSNTGNSSLLSYINPNIYVSGTNLYVSSGLVSADTLYINNTSLLLGRVEIGGNIEADDSDNTYTIGTNSTRWHTLFCKNINCSTSAYLQKITSGTITPLSDKNYDLGTTSLYWRYVYCDNVYAKTDVIGAYTSDRRLKTNIHTDDYITKILNLGDVVEFKYNSLAQSLDKGDEKQHTGIIYQDALNAGIDGLCRMEEDGYGSVNPYSRNLIFTTIGALQLTIKELLSIKEKIAKLEEEIRVLKAQL